MAEVTRAPEQEESSPRTGRRRIGVVFPGDPSSPSTWSGTPYGVLTGLRRIGVDAVPVRAEPSEVATRLAVHAISVRYLRPGRDPRASITRAREAARNSLALGRLSTWAAPRRLRDAGHLDGVVQIGTGYLLPSGTPLATFDDMTVPQVRTWSYPGWDLFSDRALDARVRLQRAAYDRSVAVCTTSRWAARSVVEDHGVEVGKVHVVGVGQNHAASRCAEKDWSTPRFLFIGMQWERKNGPAVLRAFARLREEWPDATLDLVGGHPLVDRPGVTGHGVLRLDVPEQRDAVERLFAAATCFVMPSVTEASAISYVEAGAHGVASIASRAGGSDFLVGDGGLVVDPHDDEALLEAMRTLADPATAARTGAAARRRSSLFTWPQVARRLLVALEGGAPEFALD